MADIASLGIRVTTSGVKQAETDLGRLSKEAASAERASKNLGTSIGRYLGVGLTALIGGGIAGIISSTIEAEKAQAQLAAVLKSTGGAAGLSAAELNKMANSLQAITTFDDEAITGAQSLLLTFTKIGRDVFPDATRAVLDMSQALGQDLKSSAVQLGKALNDPVQGITALQRVGVAFSDSQKDIIKGLVETGQAAEAQRLILAELTTEFGGSAEAARNTLGGALQGLKNDFGDLLEGDSGSAGIKGTTEAINSLGETMRSEGVKAGFASMIGGLANVAKFAFEATAALNGNTEAARQNGLANAQKSYIGLLQRRFEIEDALGKNFVQRDIKDAFKSDQELKSELAKVSRLEAQLRAAEKNSATAPVSRASAPPDPKRVSPETAKLAARLREEAAAYGLARSAALELDRAKALGNATTEAEKNAINGAYDALIRKVKAGEGAAAGSKAQAAAERERTKAEQEAKRTTEERVQANKDFTHSLEDLQAQQDGPLAQSNLQYARQQAELNELAAKGAVGADKLAEATKLLTAARDKDAAKIADELNPFGKLIEAKREELRLMSLSEAAYRTSIDLRGQDVQATDEQRAALEELNQTLIDQERVTSALDSVRNSFADNFADVITGAKSAKDAFEDFAQTIINNIAKIIAQNVSTSIFGGMGTSGAGTGGGGILGALFSSLVGGGRAIGGPVSGNRLYEVGEGGKAEMFESRGRKYLIPGADGKVTPGTGGGRQGPVIGAVHVNVPEGTTRQTATHIAAQVSQALALAQRSA